MRFRAFTLAELLIALAILGVIATFTIPKVLQTTQDVQRKAIAKEVAATVAGALEAYKIDNAVSASDKFNKLTPYINYVRTDTVKVIDNFPGDPSPGVNCTLPHRPCIVLANGAYVMYHFTGNSFADGYLLFMVDPEGFNSSRRDSVMFAIYPNSRITTAGVVTGNAADDPTWFSWN